MFKSHKLDEAIQLPWAINGVPHLHLWPIRLIASANEVEEARLETDYTKFNNKQYSNNGCVQQKQKVC